MSILCLIAIVGLSLAAETPTLIRLNSTEGNLSTKDISSFRMVDFFGFPSGINAAEVVKFKAPKPGFTLRGFSLVGYDGYNGTRESLPEPQIIAYEIRDKNFNLLHSYADSQIPYTNFIKNSTNPVAIWFDLPLIPVSDEFYLLFYDRGAVGVIAELNAEGQSSFYDRLEGVMYKAEIPTKNNETIPINWVMSVVGT
jgi:hypothetical protein